MGDKKISQKSLRNAWLLVLKVDRIGEYIYRSLSETGENPAWRALGERSLNAHATEFLEGRQSSGIFLDKVINM